MTAKGYFNEGVACSDLFHVLVESKTSLYLCTQSSLNRDFTRLMWLDRWILSRKNNKQITRQRRYFTGWGIAVGTQIHNHTHALTSQTCGFAHHCMLALWEKEEICQMNNMKHKQEIYSIYREAVHTASQPVFTIMLMNCCYLL